MSLHASGQVDDRQRFGPKRVKIYQKALYSMLCLFGVAMVGSKGLCRPAKHLQGHCKNYMCGNCTEARACVLQDSQPHLPTWAWTGPSESTLPIPPFIVAELRPPSP